MQVLQVFPEMVPFIKTGGLADVAGALPLALANAGANVTTMLPLYPAVDRSMAGMRQTARIEVPFDGESFTTNVHETSLAPEGHGSTPVRAVFLENDAFFSGSDIYSVYDGGGGPEIARRFAFFSKAALETAATLRVKPDIVHGHDWTSGLLPLYLMSDYSDNPTLAGARVLFTIHNNSYQGTFSTPVIRQLGLPDAMMHFLTLHGLVNFLKAAISTAHAVNTVSEGYAEEILTDEFGKGLEGIHRLNAWQGRHFGIVNGLDIDEWNPATDPHIRSRFSTEQPLGKERNRRALREEYGLADKPDQPIVAVLSRLSAQKGLNVIGEAIPEIMERSAQMVVLGHGELKDMALSWQRDHDDLGVYIGYTEEHAHRVLAGADILLMPSHWEPCGLVQMMAMRYGVIPVVSNRGGLKDTVTPFNALSETGTGFLFDTIDAPSMLAALDRAIATWRDRNILDVIMRNCMTSDFGWGKSAERYIELYERILSNGTPSTMLSSRAASAGL